ncbi:MAG: neutral zinc metallopeptidase [Hyphomicrobiales bacterium]
MRWEDFRRSDNVEDSRGEDGGFTGVPGGAGGLGIGGVVILSLIGWALGIDPSLLIGGAEVLTGGGQQQRYEQPGSSRSRAGVPNDDMGQFVSAVLGNTEDTWKVIFQQSGQSYRAPRLKLFTGAIQGGCGAASAAMGPFYCPQDQRIYLDTSFFRQIETRFRGCTGKACKFSQAYVLAHEVGHHVQNSLGLLTKANQAQRASGNRAEANRIQVRVELQADCFAGVWAFHSEQRKSFLDPGDVDAALQTASAIGDDTLQRQSQGRVVPDAFTHGSAEQRKRWFTTGFTQGKVSACNTFTAASL